MERIAGLGLHLDPSESGGSRQFGFRMKSSSMKMGGGAKQFGVDAERVPAMLKRMGQLGLDFEGFHIFSGSQNLKVQPCRKLTKKRCSLASPLPSMRQPSPNAEYRRRIRRPYFPGDEALDSASVGDNLGPAPGSEARTAGGAYCDRLGTLFGSA